MAKNIVMGQINQPVVIIDMLVTVSPESTAANALSGDPVIATGNIPGVAENDFDSVTGFTPVNTSCIAELSVKGRTSAGNASGVVTSNNTNVSDGDTVVVGGVVYTFKTSLTPLDGEVLIGSGADASLTNLSRAINHTGTPGTDYSKNEANPFVTASAVASHAVTVTAIQTGTGQTLIATTKVAATLTWGTTTLVMASANAAINAGDGLYMQTDGTIDKNSGGASAVKYGMAFGNSLQTVTGTDTRSGQLVASGATTTIRVWVGKVTF